MKNYIFGAIAGLVVSVAGGSILDAPLKTAALILVLVAAHFWARDES